MSGGPEFYNRRKGFEFKASSGPLGLKIENRVGVQAPPAIVWEILHDLAAWPEWNPIYPETAGEVRIGQVVTLTRALPDQPPEPLQATVIDWTPDELLHLKRTALRGLVAVTHYWEIDTLEREDCCAFSNGELYLGWLGPSVGRRIRRSLRKGVTAVGAAMKARAEALWRERRGAPTSAP